MEIVRREGGPMERAPTPSLQTADAWGASAAREAVRSPHQSPHESRAARLRTATFETPYGAMRCASTPLGLAWVELPRASGRGFAGWLARHAPGAEVREASAPNREAIRQILEFLAGERRDFELELDLRATPFQRAVYDALCAIPYGETRTYADVARSVGQPRAVRAVGAANGANPLPLVVPCHRVIASGGKLGGYGGGLPLKRRLLAMEHARRPGRDDLL